MTNVERATPEHTAQQSAYMHEPASLYVDTAFYDWLAGVSADLGKAIVRDADGMSADQWHRITRLLSAESRLLDQQAFDRWMGLLAEDCAYWIPSERPAFDPRNGITLEFHDRRRLLDRIARLETGLAYSQFPASNTSRQWGGLEIWASQFRKNEWHARYNFTLAESRNGHNRLLAGWNGFVLRETGSGSSLTIVVKQINLIDCDRPQGNNSFFL